MPGVLTLVPSPIDEKNPLEQTAFDLLSRAINKSREKSIFVIEELKAGRRRWLRWGLLRDVVSDFVLYNEHNAAEVSLDLLRELKDGKDVYLISDGGLPAFCDPGLELVDLCHDNGIKVTSTPFPNSVVLALALSGYRHNKFIFEGFLPQKKEQRIHSIDEILIKSNSITVILMDTPYRLKKTLEELDSRSKHLKLKKEIFLAMDLNSDQEELHRARPAKILQKLKHFKREFIIVIS